jgi:hypothetical protein
MSWADALGWIGAGLFLVSYVATSSGSLAVRSPTYQGANVLAAGLFVVASSSRHAWPSVALNVVWIAVGLVALARLRADQPPRNSAGSASAVHQPPSASMNR